MKIKLIAHCNNYFECGKEYVGYLAGLAHNSGCSVRIMDVAPSVISWRSQGKKPGLTLRCVPQVRTTHDGGSVYISPAWYTFEESK